MDIIRLINHNLLNLKCIIRLEKYINQIQLNMRNYCNHREYKKIYMKIQKKQKCNNIKNSSINLKILIKYQ